MRLQLHTILITVAVFVRQPCDSVRSVVETNESLANSLEFHKTLLQKIEEDEVLANTPESKGDCPLFDSELMWSCVWLCCFFNVTWSRYLP